ncbi:hypothetical protein HD806DRAFT_496683 [Xylariaceae sp. AK1471]|nr:hypothetical protein HD806DRAFT_496683 [Xylariaceae sp. AK1471]
MAQDALHVGQCYCETGRKRYHIKPSVLIPWESAATVPLPLNHPAGLDFQVPSDSDSDSDSDMTNDQIPQGDATQGNAHPHILPDNPLLLLLSHALNEGVNVNVNVNVNMDEDEEEEEEDDDDDDDEDNDDDGDDDFDFDDAFGPASEPGDIAPPDGDVEDGLNGDVVPGIASYRLNLTALSQRYNIYAVAYKDKIHIFRVRSCIDNALPARPDLILKPPASAESLRVGGYLDRIFPHQVNHLIMGDLGDAEILLLAYDDGDVIGYYTSQIQTELERLESRNPLYYPTLVKPFFHQNVEISAWGLAVHTQSRLIAIGTNKRNVHVFAFGLTDLLRAFGEGNAEVPYTPELFLHLTKSSEGVVSKISEALLKELDEYRDLVAEGSSELIENPLFYRRERSYRIILETGDQGNNIPNVAFSSDTNGDAVEVLAIDVSGNLWVMDIWSLDGRPHWHVEGLHKTYYRSVLLRKPRRRVPIDSLPRGWGVLVLPESSFMPTSTFQDSLGLKPKEAVYVNHDGYGYYIGTKKAVQYVKENSTDHPWVRSQQSHRFGVLPNWQRVEECRDWYDSKVDCKQDWSAVQDEAADQFAKQHPRTLRKRNNADAKPTILLADGSSVMRTYEMDIELMGGDLDNIGIMLDNVIYQKKPSRAVIPQINFPPERLANLLHVPELSMVVAGSLCGRVALITLTRPTNPHYSFKRGFKVEAILPTSKDEDRRLRPICPLLGVAIGPIPSSGKDDRLLGERRYRIMLHYYDLRILSYEVYRNITTNELSVVWR